MRVYLIRHAEAQPPGGAADIDRRLTDDGLRQARAAGAALKALGVKLDGILSSPLLRACQTAQEISARLDPSPAVEIRERLASGAAPATYFEELGRWTRGDVALVGHMPDLARIAAVLLAAEPEISLAFAPSAACCIDVDLAAQAGKLVWFHGPDRLAELASA
jgi:phosphohistidine phosphatase